MDTSRDAGSIPAASTTAHDAGTGRATSCAGLHMSQAGHTPQVADSPHVENGTARDVGPSQPGHLRNTISAQQEHNESITGEARPPDLAAVVEGYAIGSTRPLKGIRLPGVAELDKLMTSLQKSVASVRIEGTLGKPDVKVVSFPEISSALRRLLWVQLRK